MPKHEETPETLRRPVSPVLCDFYWDAEYRRSSIEPGKHRSHSWDECDGNCGIAFRFGTINGERKYFTTISR